MSCSFSLTTSPSESHLENLEGLIKWKSSRLIMTLTHHGSKHTKVTIATNKVKLKSTYNHNCKCLWHSIFFTQCNSAVENYVVCIILVSDKRFKVRFKFHFHVSLEVKLIWPPERSRAGDSCFCQAQGPTPGHTQGQGQGLGQAQGQDMVWSWSGQVRSDTNSNSNSNVGPELYTKIGFHHHSPHHL